MDFQMPLLSHVTMLSSFNWHAHLLAFVLVMPCQKLPNVLFDDVKVCFGFTKVKLKGA